MEKTRKIVARKCYKNLQLLLMPISGLKDLPIGKTQVTTRARLPMFTNWKNTSYNSIFLIVGLYDQLLQIRIDASRLL